MDYPPDFPPQARAQLTAKAATQNARPAIRWRYFGSSEARKRTMRRALSDQDTKQAYQKLQGDGFKSTDRLWEFVGMIVWLHSEQADREPAWWKTTEALTGLPRDTRALAGRIERLNADPRFFLDRQLVNLPATLLDRQFRELPTILRQYAEQVDGRLRLLHGKRKPKETTKVLDVLSHLVLNETGKPHHADLARILTAAVRESTKHPGFDFEAKLKMRARRAWRK